MKVKNQANLVHAINSRQLYGRCQCPVYANKISTLSQKSKIQIPVKTLLASSYNLFKKGHVLLGFSSCGGYLFSYCCKTSNVGFFQFKFLYTLYWWKFDLGKPLKLVYESKLFANHDVRENLVLCVSDTYSCKYIVVSGTIENNQSNHSTYVSVIWKPKEDFGLHFSYEVLSPHPRFPYKLCHKIPNTLFSNSGDIVFALSWLKINQSKHSSRQPCYCFDSTNFCSKNNTSADGNKTTTNETLYKENKCKEFSSYVVQGFTDVSEGEGSNQDILPFSPFDFMATVIQCNITSSTQSTKYQLKYEHRCFKKLEKGELNGCSFVVSQAQFDVENFINVAVQNDFHLSRIFVSLKDYDVEIVDACARSNSLIITLNALLVLQDTVQVNDEKSCVDESISPTSSFSLYILGYVIEWAFRRNQVSILHQSKPRKIHSTIRSGEFNPSQLQSRMLKKKWAVPMAETKKTITLTNQSVFMGRSLEYLLHPYLPVAVTFDQDEVDE